MAWALIAGLLFAQLLFFIMGVFGAGWFARVTLVPPAVLVPIIMALSFIGGIVDRGLLADVGVVLAFGVIGYVLQRGRFPIACLILGMILGPLMEDNLYRALIISQNDLHIFFDSPISIAIWVVTALALAWSTLPLSRWLGRARASGA